MICTAIKNVRWDIVESIVKRTCGLYKELRFRFQH